MGQTNRPEGKHDDVLREDSLEEIISWGSPIITTSNASQEDLFSSKRTFDFLDDEDVSVEQDPGQGAADEKKASCPFSDSGKELGLEIRDLESHQSSSGNELGQDLSEDLNKEHHNACTGYRSDQDDDSYICNCSKSEQHSTTGEERSEFDDESPRPNESSGGAFSRKQTDCSEYHTLSSQDTTGGKDLVLGQNKCSRKQDGIQDSDRENHIVYDEMLPENAECIASHVSSVNRASDATSEQHQDEYISETHNHLAKFDLEHSSECRTTNSGGICDRHAISVASLKDIFEDGEESSQDFFGESQTIFGQSISEGRGNQDLSLMEETSTDAIISRASGSLVEEDSTLQEDRDLSNISYGKLVRDGLEFISSDEFECVPSTMKAKKASTLFENDGLFYTEGTVSSTQFHSDSFDKISAVGLSCGANSKSTAQISISGAMPELSKPNVGPKPSQDQTENHSTHLPTQSFQKPDIHRPSGIRAVVPQKSSLCSYHPIVKFCGETLLVYARVCTRRYLDAKIVEKSLNTLQLYKPVVPTVSESSFRNKTILHVLSAKNLENNHSKISSLLNIAEKDVFDSDISIVIDKNFLNGSLGKSENILDSAESISRFIKCSDKNTREILKFKMGLVSSENLAFEPENLFQIASSRDRNIIKSFILSQKNTILFFAVFYRLGLVDFEDYRHVFHNNIYHQYVLSRLGICESFSAARQSRNGWNIMNMVDFGISKILSIDQTQGDRNSSILDCLIPEEKTSLTTGDYGGTLDTADDGSVGRSTLVPGSRSSLKPPSMSPPTPSLKPGQKTGLPSHNSFLRQDKVSLKSPSSLSIPQKSSSVEQSIKESNTSSSGIPVFELHGEGNKPSAEPSCSDSVTETPESGVQDGLAANLGKNIQRDSSKTLFDDSGDDFEMPESSSRTGKSSLQDDLSQEVGSFPLPDESQDGATLHANSTKSTTPSVGPLSYSETAHENATANLEISADTQSGPFVRGESSVYKHPNVSFGSVSSLENLGGPDGGSKSESIVYKTGSGSRSSSNLEEENSGYKKKFSKSFADIFTLEGDSAVSDSLDVSSYVPEAKEGDRPLMESHGESDSKTSVISSLFGFFRKKQSGPSKSEDDPYTNRFNRPLKAELRVPEKERRVIHSSYANKEQAENFEIPGFRQSKK